MTTSHFKTTYDLNKDSFKTLKPILILTNPMQTPRLVKVVISNGFGSVKDKKKIELIAERLARITGQKPAVRATKKAIATFKTRVGDPVGYQITLRGKRMYEFMDRLIHVALPRTKDFRGVSRGAIDDMGNITVGIKESGVFPEVADQDVRDSFGFAVTIVTTARSKAEAAAFLVALGLPLAPEKAEKKKA